MKNCRECLPNLSSATGKSLCSIRWETCSRPASPVRKLTAGVAHFMSQLFPAESGALYMLNPSRNLVEEVADWGKLPPREAVFHPDECWALRLGELHAVHDCLSGLGLPAYNRAAAGRLSLRASDGLGGDPGNAGLLNYGSQGGLTEANRALAVTAAKQISLALANLRLRGHPARPGRARPAHRSV